MKKVANDSVIVDMKVENKKQKNSLRKTNAQFVKEVKECVGEEYTPLSDYINAKHKVLMRHNFCGYEWRVNPTQFIHSNSRCPSCTNRLKRTTKKFKKEVYELVGDEYSVLGEYVNTNIKIKMKHNKCGCQWDVLPSQFLYSLVRCPVCNKKKTAITQQYEEDFFNLVNDDYKIIRSFAKSTIPIKIKHNECGYEYEILPYDFFREINCPNCGKEKVKLNHQLFLKKVREITGNEYIVLGQYKNFITKVLLVHNKCGYEWRVNPLQFLQKGVRCPKCSKKRNKRIKTTSDIVQEVYKRVGNRFSVLDEYVNSKTKILVQHNEDCGHIWKVNPGYFLAGNKYLSKCPQCGANGKTF